MKQSKILNRLVENAIDFLEKSLEELESSPKYSVIHFHAAVELFLKARLLAEHWSLVVSKKQEPDWKKFEEGDFLSVSFEEAALKLDKALQSPLMAKEIKTFKALAKHRNRMVHFYHQADSKKSAAEELRKIAKEQLTAWYLLHRILLDRWKDVFYKWEPKFLDFSRKLKKLHGFLQVAFDEQKPEIERLKNTGALFQECPSCRYPSQQMLDYVGELKMGICLVCDYNCTFVTIDCPDCHNSLTLFEEGYGTCDKCGRKIEPEDLYRIFTPARHPKECLDDASISCGNCEGYETVVEQEEGCFCTNCFEAFTSSDLGQCSWCGSINAGGDMESSEWSGCAVCEGRGDWDKD